jgi:hypothetical protein
MERNPVIVIRIFRCGSEAKRKNVLKFVRALSGGWGGDEDADVDVDAAVPGAAALLPSCVHGAIFVGPWSCLVNKRF